MAAHPVPYWVCLCLLVVACNEPEPLPGRQDYAFEKPANFPEPTYSFKNNPVTKEGFLLGKKLFFDPVLSKDGSVSCNSCHIQSTAFADSQQHPLSIGINNQAGMRNAPSLANMAFFPDFFWDGGVNHLDFVAINAIESDFEMGETLAGVIRKLNKATSYPEMFKKAFGTTEVTAPLMLQALSQFMVMMVSGNSAYDHYIRNEGVTLTARELRGMALFITKCSTCHQGELFTDFSYRNNGISKQINDAGRGRITESLQDMGKFRVPSLRNVARTAPYMHNAKFNTLREVLDHYDTGIHYTPTLDPSLVDGIAMSEEDKSDIITFLETLTDYDFRSDQRFMND